MSVYMCASLFYFRTALYLSLLSICLPLSLSLFLCRPVWPSSVHLSEHNALYTVCVVHNAHPHCTLAFMTLRDKCSSMFIKEDIANAQSAFKTYICKHINTCTHWVWVVQLKLRFGKNLARRPNRASGSLRLLVPSYSLFFRAKSSSSAFTHTINNAAD